MLVNKNWIDYKILSCGDGEKIEQWGNYILNRPDPQIIWPKNKKMKVDAAYRRSAEGGGYWENEVSQQNWQISYPSKAGILKFELSLMNFKHTGLFPEQAVNWDYIQECIIQRKKENKNVRILNLFAYTGAATLASAIAGADEVVHIDASKKIIERAKRNLQISSLQDKYVRFIQDDVMKFLAREKRRNSLYDGIIMDPPAYGRGPNGELWQIENSFSDLIKAAIDILKDNPSFLQISAYANNLSPQVFKNILLQSDLIKKNGYFWADEIGLPINDGPLILPCGYSIRWTAQDIYKNLEKSLFLHNE